LGTSEIEKDFLLFLKKKRSKQPERYTPFFLKFPEIMATAASMPP
jgi:hypothetical protein